MAATMKQKHVTLQLLPSQWTWLLEYLVKSNDADDDNVGDANSDRIDRMLCGSWALVSRVSDVDADARRQQLERRCRPRHIAAELRALVRRRRNDAPMPIGGGSAPQTARQVVDAVMQLYASTKGRCASAMADVAARRRSLADMYDFLAARWRRRQRNNQQRRAVVVNGDDENEGGGGGADATAAEARLKLQARADGNMLGLWLAARKRTWTEVASSASGDGDEPARKRLRIATVE